MKKYKDNHNLPAHENHAMAHRMMGGWAALVLAVCFCTVPALAAGDDPLTIVNNLSDFIFSCIKAIGIIILGWGVVQVGMSVQSHDASQRSQGFLSSRPLAGGAGTPQCRNRRAGDLPSARGR